MILNLEPIATAPKNGSEFTGLWGVQYSTRWSSKLDRWELRPDAQEEWIGEAPEGYQPTHWYVSR